MQLLTAAPATAADLETMYLNTPREGMIFSGAVKNEHFDIATCFDENLFCAALAWSVGGEEEYALAKANTIVVRSAGALALARGARYAYRAKGETPFRSHMISFPHWITDAAAAPCLDETNDKKPRTLDTNLVRPDALTQKLMDAVIEKCRTGAASSEWYGENCALLYGALLDLQDRDAFTETQLEAVKASTRTELARRAKLAKTMILQCFGEAGLTLKDIASEACLSPYHLIRVFKVLTGATPMQFLGLTRMDAARRLLTETTLSVSDVAERVGYSDRTAFFKAFRKHYGYAPSAATRKLVI